MRKRFKPYGSFVQVVWFAVAGLLAIDSAAAESTCVNELARAHELRVLHEIQITELMERFDVVVKQKSARDG